jgi:hypothetical protein
MNEVMELSILMHITDKVGQPNRIKLSGQALPFMFLAD